MWQCGEVTDKTVVLVFGVKAMTVILISSVKIDGDVYVGDVVC